MINGLFPTKDSVSKLVSGHACWILENPSTVGAPRLCSSCSENQALGARFGAGDGMRTAERNSEGSV